MLLQDQIHRCQATLPQRWDPIRQDQATLPQRRVHLDQCLHLQMLQLVQFVLRAHLALLKQRSSQRAASHKRMMLFEAQSQANTGSQTIGSNYSNASQQTEEDRALVIPAAMQPVVPMQPAVPAAVVPNAAPAVVLPPQPVITYPPSDDDQDDLAILPPPQRMALPPPANMDTEELEERVPDPPRRLALLPPENMDEDVQPDPPRMLALPAPQNMPEPRMEDREIARPAVIALPPPDDANERREEGGERGETDEDFHGWQDTSRGRARKRSDKKLHRENKKPGRKNDLPYERVLTRNRDAEVDPAVTLSGLIKDRVRRIEGDPNRTPIMRGNRSTSRSSIKRKSKKTGNVRFLEPAANAAAAVATSSKEGKNERGKKRVRVPDEDEWEDIVDKTDKRQLDARMNALMEQRVKTLEGKTKKKGKKKGNKKKSVPIAARSKLGKRKRGANIVTDNEDRDEESVLSETEPPKKMFVYRKKKAHVFT